MVEQGRPAETTRGGFLDVMIRAAAVLALLVGLAAASVYLFPHLYIFADTGGPVLGAVLAGLSGLGAWAGWHGKTLLVGAAAALLYGLLVVGMLGWSAFFGPPAHAFLFLFILCLVRSGIRRLRARA